MSSCASSCTLHGQCINNTCICNAGWTGHSDLVDRSGYDCNVNIIGVKSLYVILLIFGLLGMILGCYRLQQGVITITWSNFIKKFRASAVYQYTAIVTVIEFSQFFWSLGHLLLDQRVGYDVWITISWIVQFSSVILSVRSVMGIFISLFLSMFNLFDNYSGKSQLKYELTSKMSKIMDPLTIISLVLTWIFIADVWVEQDQKEIFLIYVWHLIFFILTYCILSLAFMIQYVARALQRHAREVGKDQRESHQQSLQKLKKFQYLLVINIFFPTVFCLLSAWYPPLRDQTAYIFPGFVVSGSPVAIFCLYLFKTEEKKNPESRENPLGSVVSTHDKTTTKNSLNQITELPSPRSKGDDTSVFPDASQRPLLEDGVELGVKSATKEPAPVIVTESVMGKEESVRTIEESTPMAQPAIWNPYRE